MLYKFSKQLIINQQKQIRVINSRSVSSINLAPYGHSFGPVGRSANSGITATVFGAYGFIGRYIMEELGKLYLFKYISIIFLLFSTFINFRYCKYIDMNFYLLLMMFNYNFF